MNAMSAVTPARLRGANRLFGFLVSTCLALTLSLQAQTDTARLQGVINDPSGAVVPGANITATQTATNRVNTTKSGPDGTFSISSLPIGDYVLRVEIPGFQAYSQRVHLDPGQLANVNVNLTTGEVTQTVNVTEEGAQVESASSDLGATIQGRQVTDLPLNGRNFTQLATLVPGVTRGVPNGPASGAGGDAETFRYGNVGGASLSVNGLRPQANNFILDGIDNNESLVNTIVFFPSAEAIQEFRVETSVAPAEFGRAGGAIINTSVRSGANDLHFTAFEFLRNSELDARPTFAPSRNPFRRNQFGGTIGMPIIKNKLFIFGDYQGLRQSTPLQTDFVTVPTQAFRSGDFSALLNPAISGLSQAYVIRNAATGQPYPGNIIPPSQINPVGQAYLNAYPLPNIAGKVQQNYAVQRQQAQTFDDFDVRADWNISDPDRAFFRFSFNQDSSATSSRFANLPAGFGSGTNFQQPRGFSLGETHTLSATAVNDIRLGWQRSFFGYNPPLGNTPVSANLGIPNANTSPLLGGGALIGGNGGQLEYTGDYGSYTVPENSYQISDSLTKVISSHTVRFGGQVIWRQVNLFRPRAGKGFFNLFGNGTGAGSTTGSTGYETSDVLAGFVSNYQIGAQTGYFGTRSWENGLYVQDDWRVNQRLTINAGLRYDILTWPSEVHNRQSNFDFSTGQIVLAGANGQSSSLVDNNFNNFAPRIGFAYQLDRTAKTVVRGGYGMFYFIDRGGINNQLAQNPPFSGISQYNYTDGYRITLSGAAPIGSNSPVGATGALPSPGATNFNPANPQNVSLVAALRNNPTSYVQQWNLQVQRQILPETVVSVAYVGTAGRHLTFYYDANQQVFNGASGQRAYPNLGSLTVQANRGNSDYNSLQAQLEKRFSHGLQLRASYTYSHAIDDSDGAFDGGSPQDIRNFQLERGNASIDQRHVFVGSGLYELPFGHNRAFGNGWNRPVDTVLGGWQLNSIFTWGSGLPFNIVQSGSQRPDVMGPVQVFQSPNLWFDTSVFSPAPANSAGVFVRPGNLARNALYGPGVVNVDFSLFKDFSLTERLKLQFRSEFYNIANHPRFANPDGNLSDGNFGRITSTILGSERQIQFAARISF